MVGSGRTVVMVTYGLVVAAVIAVVAPVAVAALRLAAYRRPACIADWWTSRSSALLGMVDGAPAARARRPAVRAVAVRRRCAPCIGGTHRG